MKAIPIEEVPSKETARYWIYASNPHDKRMINPNTCGKFMLFINKDELDEKWLIVKKATEDGLFGFDSKCSTAKESPNAINDYQGVICIYTANIKDMGEIKCVEKNIRKIMNHTGVLHYKADIQTMAEPNGKSEFTYLYEFQEDDNNYYPKITILSSIFVVCIMIGYGISKIKKY